VRQRYGRTIKKATKLTTLDIRRAKAWLCLSCLVPQYGNLKRHEISRCPCKGKDHKGMYPMNALGTDIEREPRIVRMRQMKRINYVEKCNDPGANVYNRIRDKLKSSRAAFKRFQNMDPMKWHDCQRGDAERALRFFMCNLYILRPDRYG
jgi:hypothetical protein